MPALDTSLDRTSRGSPWAGCYGKRGRHRQLECLRRLDGRVGRVQMRLRRMRARGGSCVKTASGNPGCLSRDFAALAFPPAGPSAAFPGPGPPGP